MSEPALGLVAIGNALVDVLSHCEESFIESQKDKGMIKSSMMLIDENRAAEIYTQLKSPIEMSGGSAGNTIAAFASLGGKGGYIGKVADDTLGDVFINDLESMDVRYNTQKLILGQPTGHCIILVTPDAERTMNTCLGAATQLTPADIDRDMLASAKVTYLEGYLFDQDHAKDAFFQAGNLVEEVGHKLALTLSDSFCVERHRDDFLKLIEGHVHILFANEEEIKNLFQEDDFDKIVDMLRGKCEIAAITRGENGSVIITENNVIQVEAEKVNNLEDTTGAGDAYAAGFLYGFTEGMDLSTCGRIGSIAAAEVISHMGARPEVNLAELINQKLAA